MEVDQEERVMPNGGHTEGDSAGVVVPKGDGEAATVKEREALAQLPVAPVNGAAQGTTERDALMEEVEDVKEQQANDDEDAEDDDDLFGCVRVTTCNSQSLQLI